MILDTNGKPIQTNGRGAYLNEKLAHANRVYERALMEALDLSTQYVDPLDAFRGPDGLLWEPLGSQEKERSATHFTSEKQLADARDTCRALLFTNEFAINAVENRISYVLFTGFSFTAIAGFDESEASDELISAVQDVIDRFVEENKWIDRQRETMRRRDRDGEVFLRYFTGGDVLRVRFVEPSQVATPKDSKEDRDSWGIRTDPDDVEMVEGYWVDGQLVAADQIQHRKLGVDLNVKRGVPLLWPVYSQLKRVEQLQKNMDAVAGIQTAIAMIRQHEQASKSTVEGLRNALANVTQTHAETGTTRYYTQYPPGTILDVPMSTKYEFPASGIDAGRFVEVKQSALRAVAARLLMPEFMLTAKSDDVNYASALVAEGPAVKNFERLQAEQRDYDLQVIWRAIDHAVMNGQLPVGIEEIIDIDVGMPRVASRDLAIEAATNETYERMGVKSIQTITGELGLDYRQEQENIERHKAEHPSEPDFPQLTGLPGDDELDDDALDDEESDDTL